LVASKLRFRGYKTSDRLLIVLVLTISLVVVPKSSVGTSWKCGFCAESSDLHHATVTAFKWANPHTLVLFDVKDHAGNIAHWAGKAHRVINYVFRTHKNDGDYLVAESNDPDKTCDPLGFPRDGFMTRGIGFASMSDRIIQMWQYDKTWPQIYTDGRPLPTNVGANTQ